MSWVYERLADFTTATVDEYCGGLTKSNELLNTLTSILCKPGLFEKLRMETLEKTVTSIPDYSVSWLGYEIGVHLWKPTVTFGVPLF